MTGSVRGWLRRQFGGEPSLAGAPRDRHPVLGDTPAAEALRAWLLTRAKLEEVFAPLEQRLGAGVDRAALTALRHEENLAWQEYRTRRLEGESQ
ncbi:hypothetical protein AB0H57_14395 [Micromonospora sp. NPDC050686]|uniref:hypothetical protein n=1 Tax=Micromonospora sp. NPDC050686 TaxID=3154631 RepID=UPI0033EF067E